MSTTNTTIIEPNGCPVENLPEDPTRLFSSSGITLDLPRIGWIGSGVCAVVASVISFFLIYRHYQYYTKPNQQRYIVRMLLMVPIYAITSWFSFVYVRESIYYDTIRVLYEAFVIASFFILILQYMGDSLEEQKRVLKRHKKTERWFFPLCCLKYNPSRQHFLQYMKWGILQYVPLNILITILTVVLQIEGSYCEGSWNPKFGHVWVMLINFCSVTAATYFLIMFYLTIHKDLKEYDPFYKFLAIKLVVFFSFWQSVVIEGLVYFNLIKATTYWSTADISTGVNSVLIDIEMVFFALIHLKAFSYKPYVPLIPNPDYQPQKDDNENSKTINNPNNRNNYPSMDSLRSNRIPGGRPPMSVVSQQPSPKVRPSPNVDSKDKDSKKEPQGPPEKIMDLTQKTPVWKGMIDSFNPLDTIRELGYGIQYLYRWIRGIPVDKDSRRLLDLERAFGRQRPEVPYTPSKEELEEEEKKKKKKKKKKGQESESSGANDTDGNDDNDNNGGNGLEKYDLEGRNDRNNIGGDLEMGNISGRNGTSNRYPRYPDESYAPSQRRAYDMAFDSPGGTLRSGGVGSGPSRAVRKPVRPIPANFGSSSTVVARRAGTDRSLQAQKKDNVEYLGKEEAAHTERATLPDIQLEPIERKIALSGLYVDMPPLSPIDIPESPSSSLDIPVPVNYHQQSYSSGYEDQPHTSSNQQSMRFNHRDPELERASIPYVLPDPIAPAITRTDIPNMPPVAIAAAAAPSTLRNAITQGTGSGFTQFSRNDRELAADVPFEAEHSRNTSERYRHNLSYSLQPPHQREESGESSIVTTSEFMGIGVAQRQFYHQREASRSDPELAHRRVDEFADQDQIYDSQDCEKEREQLHNYPPQQQAQPEQAISQSQPQQDGDISEPKDDIDPIVAQYNLLQYRQKVQERQQQEIEQQKQKQQQKQQQKPRQQQRGPRQPLQHRRNSLESLDSDSSGGVFRARAMAAAYERNYGHGSNSSSRPKEGRYQRAYRYPMPVPRVAPVQFYRFPEDREIYEQRKQEQQLLQQQYNQQPISDPSMRVPSTVQRRERLYQPQQQYSRPYYEDSYSHYTQGYNKFYPEGYEHSYDPRFRSPPVQQIDPRSRSIYPSPPARRTTADYLDERGQDREFVRQDTGEDGLFPASRYAAPFVRDYELQMREGRRRMTNGPPTPSHQPGVIGVSRFLDDGPYNEAMDWRRTAGPTGALHERP